MNLICKFNKRKASCGFLGLASATGASTRNFLTKKYPYPKNYNLLVAIFIIFLLFGVNFTPIFAQSNAIQVDLGVEGCNNDGVCDLNENELSCPADCTVVPPPPPPPPGGGGGSGGGIGIINNIYISNLVVEPDYTSAKISWDSSVGTVTTVKWGETSDVAEGSLSSILFAVKHKVELTNLKPGTMYYFVIDSRDTQGNTSAFPPVFFFTKFLKDTTFPLNPRNVKAVADVPGITITWENPPDDNFDYIRIMRHEDRFRGNPFLGTLIYEGRGEKFLDTKVIAGKKYFYTLFARDINGDFSSGVGVSATAYSEKEIPPIITPPIKPPTEEKPGIEIPKDLTQNFFVYQYNKFVEPLLKNKIVTIDGDKSTIIDTVTKTQPDDLINVFNREGKIIGQYLFAFNSDSGRYQGVIPPLEKKGVYNIKIYRYKNEMPIIIGEGSIYIKDSVIPEVEQLSCNYYGSLYGYAILIFIILILLILLILCKRDKKKNHRK